MIGTCLYAQRKLHASLYIWVSSLNLLESITVPRCLNPVDGSEVKYELHHFADASQLAYGGASYMRIEDNNGNIFCSFPIGKGFVPHSRVTIPRLELQAAVAIVRLDKFLRSELLLPIDYFFFWSDSMPVVKSIANSKKKFPDYVANRIAKIERNTHIENRRHVPTKLNPADEVSRGVQANRFVKKSK